MGALGIHPARGSGSFFSYSLGAGLGMGKGEGDWTEGITEKRSGWLLLCLWKCISWLLFLVFVLKSEAAAGSRVLCQKAHIANPSAHRPRT